MTLNLPGLIAIILIAFAVIGFITRSRLRRDA